METKVMINGDVATYKGVRIRARDRVQQGAPAGMDCGWREYQILSGRRIVSRHGTFDEAKRAVDEQQPGA